MDDVTTQAPGYVGIDAGVDGYSALVREGRPELFWPAPSYGGPGGMIYDQRLALEQAREWKALGVRKVVLERLTNLPPRLGGGRTNYRRGEAMGMWRTVLTAVDIPFVEVDPEEWKRALAITGPKETLKPKAVAKAKALSPSTDFRDVIRHPNSIVPSPDKAESYLLGWYCERLEKGDVAEFEEAKRLWREQDAERRRAQARDGRKKKRGKRKSKKKPGKGNKGGGR